MGIQHNHGTEDIRTCFKRNITKKGSFIRTRSGRKILWKIKDTSAVPLGKICYIWNENLINLSAMKNIELSLFRKIVAGAIAIVLEAILLLLMLYICKEWLGISKIFIKVVLSLVVASPVSYLVYRSIIESWTGEKIE